MKKRFTEEQVIGFLREGERGVAIKDLCRRHGFSEASYYLWRSKFGGMDVSDAKRLKLDTPASLAVGETTKAPTSVKLPLCLVRVRNRQGDCDCLLACAFEPVRLVRDDGACAGRQARQGS